MPGGRSDIVGNCSLTGPKPQHLRIKFLEFLDSKPFFWTVNYSWICWRHWIFKYWDAKMILGSTIFFIHEFALKLETCPSGPPREASEESAAHHLLTKIIQNLPTKWFLNAWQKVGYRGKLQPDRTKTPTFENQISWVFGFGIIFLKRQILMNLLKTLNFQILRRENDIRLYDIFHTWICVEAWDLPFGPT